MNTTVDPELSRHILDENVRVHELEAGLYDALHTEIFNRYEQASIRRLLRRADGLAGKTGARRALDIGAGTGNITMKLLDMGYQVTALDISAAMLEQLRAKAGGRAELICRPVDEHLADGPAARYSLITISSVLHHLPSYEDTLERCFRALMPGGGMLVLHEPLAGYSKRKDPFAARAVSALSNRVWRLYEKRKNPKQVYIDYTFSDYHVEEGIRPERLAAEVERLGGRVDLVHRHRVERFAAAAFLNDRVLGACPNNFGMIAVKGPR